jgi:hypothetical protein
MKRSGFADLPLHGGRVPLWLSERMSKLDGFRRLEQFVRRIERVHSPEADFNAAVTHERAISKELGGRSVYDDIKRRPKEKKQLSLFDK